MAAIMTDHGAVIVPVCPPWCERPGDHDLDTLVMYEHGGCLNRSHETKPWVLDLKHSDRDPVVIHILVTESVPRSDDDQPPVVYMKAGGEALTPGEARQVAAALLEAADKLEGIRPHSV